MFVANNLCCCGLFLIKKKKVVIIFFFVSMKTFLSKNENATTSGDKYHKCPHIFLWLYLEYFYRPTDIELNLLKMLNLAVVNSKLLAIDFSSRGCKSNWFRNMYIFKQYIAFAMHFTWCMAPGILNESPRGGTPPKKIMVNSNSSL